MLKCVMCDSVIFPNLKYEENEEISWVYCTTCDMTNCTDEQWNRFQETINKRLVKDGLKPIVMIRPTKENQPIPQTQEQNFADRYAKVDI